MGLTCSQGRGSAGQASSLVSRGSSVWPIMACPLFCKRGSVTLVVRAVKKRCSPKKAFVLESDARRNGASFSTAAGAKVQRTLTALTTEVLKATVRIHDVGECQAHSLPFCRLMWSIKGGWIFILKQKHARDCCLEALSAKPQVRHLFKRADDKPSGKQIPLLRQRPHVFFWGIQFLISISKLSWK